MTRHGTLRADAIAGLATSSCSTTRRSPPARRAARSSSMSGEAAGSSSRWASRSLPASWEGDATERLLPGAFGAPVDRAARGVTLASLDRSHPIFELFRAPRSGDFTTARVFSYRPLQLAGMDGVLARYDDGAVALAEKRVGRGRVLVWTSTLDNFWTDLALQPVYLPFVHQLLRARRGLRRVAALVHGRPGAGPRRGTRQHGVRARRRRARHDERAGGRAGRGCRERHHVARPRRRRAGRPRAGRCAHDDRRRPPACAQLAEQGFYELRPAGQANAAPYTVAVNLDLAESDLTPIDPQGTWWPRRRRPTPARPCGRGRNHRGGREHQDRERRQAFWSYLLIAALLALAAETALAGRLSRAAS